MKRPFLAMLFLICFFNRTVSAQQRHEKIIIESNYLLYLPEDYQQDSLKKFPLVLFLHGSGERGNDLDKVKAQGLPRLVEAGKKFPFILVSPQSVADWETRDLMLLLQGLEKKYRIDDERLYLTGLSMGGYGSWDMATKYPGLFAAVIPVCGGGDPSTVWNMRHTPTWVFHGAKDDAVPLKASQEMVDALRIENPSVKFTVFPEAGHDSWTAAYDTDSLYTWMLSQKVFKYKAITLDQQVLENYQGHYVNSIGNDTIRVTAAPGALIGTTRGRMVEIKPYDKNKFFISEDEPVDIVFSGKGKKQQFVINDRRREVYQLIKKE
ncbi:prolyl oligopeptidase family serine peptidase [Pedobacter sp. KBW06]|uniref:carboxylesterase family protein n=1 Tax=Pedobacter sp. KBW06 TaxID=2153359 RepID=UPI0018F29C65|nr:prolyl oligopeptidase family serine peptidase [Pedobacter sp. KBW06]